MTNGNALRPWIITNSIVIVFLVLLTIIGNHAVSVMSETKIVQPIRYIVIDAGHGGVDGGATSASGVLESKLNLDIAKRLDDLLHLLGMHTVMIRTEDISIYTEGESIAAKKVSDLKNRVRIINETPNAILISIHQNYFADDRYSGPQAFYAETPYSQELAKYMQNALVATLKPNNKRSIKKAKGIYLMNNIHCPAVLLECGFISNQAEDKLLQNAKYQQKLCCVVASSISLVCFNIPVT